MNSFFNWFSQVAIVTRFTISTIPQRAGASAAAVFGIAGVVAVLVGVLSIAQGFRHTMTISGSNDAALVMRSGADTEMTSIMRKDEARIVADAPGVVRGAIGPEVSAELYATVNLPKKSTGTDANVPVRGVEPSTFHIRRNVTIREGRHFTPGRYELMVGRGAQSEFGGIEIGDRVKIGNEFWTVVGVFTANGGLPESEIWGDVSALQSAFKRGTSFQSVFVRLTSAEAFDRFKAALVSDPRLNVKVVREAEYYSEQSKMLSNFVTGLGSLIAGLMGVGAIFGALNTMYSAVAARNREIATLRALGFGTGPVIISVLMESLFLALVGGVIGGGAAYFMFDGYQAATINWQSFSQVAFAFAVTPALLVQGAIYAAVIGFFGGLFPAIRASRLQIAVALREL